MTKLIGVVRDMLRETRRVNQHSLAKSRCKSRAVFALAMGEMRQAVQSAPQGYPVGPDRACYQGDANIVYIRMVAA